MLVGYALRGSTAARRLHGILIASNRLSTQKQSGSGQYNTRLKELLRHNSQFLDMDADTRMSIGLLELQLQNMEFPIAR